MHEETQFDYLQRNENKEHFHMPWVSQTQWTVELRN